VLDRHDRRADHARPVAERAGDDPQRAGAERDGALVDDLPDARQQGLVRFGQIAADHDHRGVERVDRRGEHLTELAAGGADHRGDLRVALAEPQDDVAHVGGGQSGGGQLERERAAACHRLEAAAVAAAAEHVVVVAHMDVADVAGGALRAPQRAPVRDQPGADPGADLHEHQVLGVGPRAGALSQRHQVGVVVDERGGAEALAQPLRDGVAVPAGHDRRRDRHAGRVLDRSGNADADAEQRAGRRAHQPLEPFLQPGEHGLRPVGDRDVVCLLVPDRAGQVGHRQARVGRAQVGGKHEARLAVEAQHLRRAAAGRRGVRLRHQQPLR
jgi:hypothetical protein